MMTISKKPLSAVLSFATVPLATLMFFAFVQKVPAQVYESSKRPVNKTVRSEKLSQTETVKSVPSDNTTTVTTSAKKQEATIEIESVSTENVKTDTIRPKKDLRNDDSVSASRRSQEYFTSENTLNEKDIIPAEYPGGYAALRQAIGENFNPSLMASNKGVFKGKIHFIIPADYPYPDIFYEFEDESFSAAIDDAVRKAMKAKWKPATKNGKPVDYTVIIPINMSFQ